MGLFSLGIASLCAGVAADGQYNIACNKAVEAGTRQYGVYQLMDRTEQKSLEIATKQGSDILGKDATEVVVIGVYSYRFYKDRAVVFKLPNLGLADTISNRITLTSYTLNFQWNIK